MASLISKGAAFATYVQVTPIFTSVVGILWAVGTTTHNPVEANTPILLVIGIPIGLIVGFAVGFVLGALVGLVRLATDRFRRLASAAVLGLVGCALCLAVFEVWYLLTPTFRSAPLEVGSVISYGACTLVIRLVESRLR